MTLREISFDIDAADEPHVSRIVDRALGLGMRADRLGIRMDLCATHANGCPLDFARLAAADDFNLAHDVGGIARHLDRSTGELTGFFSPRFARKQAAA